MPTIDLKGIDPVVLNRAVIISRQLHELQSAHEKLLIQLAKNENEQAECKQALDGIAHSLAPKKQGPASIIPEGIQTCITPDGTKRSTLTYDQ